MTRISKLTLAAVAILLLLLVGNAQTPAPASQPQAMLTQYCASCHNQTAKIAGLALDTMDVNNVAMHAKTWEKVVRKLRSGLMPPSDARRPQRQVLDALAAELESRLDRAAATAPNPG
jgi:cytochrome c551/c552